MPHDPLIHGPQACERPCVDCDPGHHWIKMSLDPSDDEGYEEWESAVIAYDLEHLTGHALAHLQCKHCPAWRELPDDDAEEDDDLSDAEADAMTFAGVYGPED